MGKDKGRVEAQTDGGLIIQVPDPAANGDPIVWSRSQYVLPFEVLCCPFVDTSPSVPTNSYIVGETENSLDGKG